MMVWLYKVFFVGVNWGKENEWDFLWCILVGGWVGVDMIIRSIIINNQRVEWVHKSKLLIINKLVYRVKDFDLLRKCDLIIYSWIERKFSWKKRIHFMCLSNFLTGISHQLMMAGISYI
jgi:hypothetical protein